MATVANVITNLTVGISSHFVFLLSQKSYQVTTDADVRITLKAVSTTKSSRIFESRDDHGEAVVGGAPAVGVVAQRHEVGPRDDEPVAAHSPGLGVARDVSLKYFLSRNKDKYFPFI